MGSFSVVVLDSDGKKFSRSWRAGADKCDAIRWTITNEDLPYYVTTDKIVSVNIIPGEETK